MAAPFTTSTLQQEAARKLRFSSRVTMYGAQRPVTKRRLHLHAYRLGCTERAEGLRPLAARPPELVAAPSSCPPAPRVYTSQSKNAQEPREAIRPAGDTFRTPDAVRGSLSNDEFRLYELIWKRTVASQMADATGSTASVAPGRRGV